MRLLKVLLILILTTFSFSEEVNTKVKYTYINGKQTTELEKVCGPNVIVTLDQEGIAKVLFSRSKAPNYRRMIGGLYIIQFKTKQEAMAYVNLLIEKFRPMVRYAEPELKGEI